MGNKLAKHRYEINNSTQSAASYSTTAPTVTIDGRSYHNIETSSYFLPRDEEEQDRLNSQHFALKALYGSNIAPAIHEKLPSHPHILDIGCGSGSWVMEVGIEYPNAQVKGIDMMDMFPTMIRPENVIFELTNVLDGIPYPDNTFDFVHMRLMITALRINEWSAVLAEIYRTVKPGGIVQLTESNFTSIEQSPLIKICLTEFLSVMQERGQDPWIASKLGSLLKEHSFEDIHVDTKRVDFGEPKNPISTEMLGNWKMALLSLRPVLCERLNVLPENYESKMEQLINDFIQYGWYVDAISYRAQKPLGEKTSHL
ncbi:S-adenosyl-L-methionine-dependent methyltransferase [Spinellus fusiger]|nr:S-adenosyl-L-methionine-dependent methyltransferase [Spinellus fusiger]